MKNKQRAFRCGDEDWALINQAAKKQGLSTNAYMWSILSRKAKRDLKK